MNNDIHGTVRMNLSTVAVERSVFCRYPINSFTLKARPSKKKFLGIARINQKLTLNSLNLF